MVEGVKRNMFADLRSLRMLLSWALKEKGPGEEVDKPTDTAKLEEDE